MMIRKTTTDIDVALARRSREDGERHLVTC